MTHDVFISHSSKDKSIADAVCSELEKAKIRCWIAPRDIRPGEKWAAAITNAIENGKIMVLIFSSNSHNSDDVLNEILLAKDAHAIIIPFKIENILPKGEMKYYLTRTHWLDAMDPPTEKHIQLLVESINQFIKVPSSISIPDVTARVEAVKLKTQKGIEKKQKEERAIEIREKQPKREEEIKEKEERSKSQEIPNSIGMEFALIPEGEFMMGSPSNEVGRYEDEGPVRRVKIPKSFYMGKYEVTQKQWRDIMGNDPSRFNGDNLPIEQVSWNDVQKFIKKLNKKENTIKYRLPSEAEWEYAARAENSTRYFFGDDDSKLGDYAWYHGNSEGRTHPVGQKKPNSWGLYDIHGNVWEWVQDKYQDTYDFVPTDGSSWESEISKQRVLRGGAWSDNTRDCRLAYRGHDVPGDCDSFLGFRLVRSL
jgi:formylglycine-generating enzyme required for sulfatase activity